MKLCICADPENCRDIPIHRVCKRMALCTCGCRSFAVMIDGEPRMVWRSVKIHMGKPHLMKIDGSWTVSVGIFDARGKDAEKALGWAAWMDLRARCVVDPQPPQLMAWSEKQDPTRWD